MSFQRTAHALLLATTLLSNLAIAQEQAAPSEPEISIEGLAQTLNQGDIGDAVDYYVQLYNNPATRAEAVAFIAKTIAATEKRIADYRGATDACQPLPASKLPTYSLNKEVPRNWLDIVFLSRVPIGWPDSLDDFSSLVYKEVQCLNDSTNSPTVLAYGEDINQTLRLRLQTIENLLARLPGNYRSILPSALNNTCESHRQKRDERLALAAKHTASRYAPRALLLSTYSTIAHAQASGCDDEDKTALLNDQVMQIEAAVGAGGIFKASTGSWRFANDLIHFGVIAAYLAGNKSAFEWFLARTNGDQPMIDEAGGWNRSNLTLNLDTDDGLKPLIRLTEIDLIEQAVQRRFYDTHLPYTDTVYVFQHLPGNDATTIQGSFLPFQFKRFYQSLDPSTASLTERLEAIAQSDLLPREALATIILYPDLMEDDLERALSACNTMVDRRLPNLHPCSANEKRLSTAPRFDVGIDLIPLSTARALAEALSGIQSTTIIRKTPLPSGF